MRARALQGLLAWQSLAKSRSRARARLTDYAIHTIEKLRFSDTDRNGHVSTAVFASCCQTARMEILCDRSRIPLPADAHFVIASLELDFYAEIHWPATVEIGTRFDRVGRCSVTIAQSLFVEQRCVAAARSIVVLVDAATRRSMPLPAETATAIRALAGSSLRAPSTRPALLPFALTWRRSVR